VTDTRDADIRDLQSQIDSLSRCVRRMKPEEDWTPVFIGGLLFILALGLVAIVL
jgi:hypothetical protein